LEPTGITLPSGNNPDDLIPTGAPIEFAATLPWKVDQKAGIITLTPQFGMTTVTERFTIKTKLNGTPGMARVTLVRRTASGTTTAALAVAKYPTEFQLSQLTADPTAVPAGGTVTLSWTG